MANPRAGHLLKRVLLGKNRLGLKPGWEKEWDALDARVLELFYGASK